MRARFRRSAGSGPRVLDANGSAVAVEGEDDLGGASNADRIAVLAHWSGTARVSRSVATTVTALDAAGYRVVVVSTSEVREPLDWSGGRPAGLTVLRRPNLGYDFGSWATAIDRYPAIAEASRVLLLNDSMLGRSRRSTRCSRSSTRPLPTCGRSPTRRSSSTTCRATSWGSRVRPSRSRRCGRSGAMSGWNASKDDVIWRYEIGLSRLLRRERYAVDVAIPFRHLVQDGKNPAIIGWQRLLDRGFPFVKRELLVRPRVAPDAEAVPRELRRRFDVDVADWV